MGFFGFGKQKAPVEERSATAPAQIQDAYFGGPVLAGPRVTDSRVMGLSAHFACVRLIATTLASLPLHIYERTPEGKKRRAEHPAARLLHDQPNPDMTAFSFVEAMQAQVSNRGKAFAEIVFDRKGYPAELWPIPPGKVQPRRRKDGAIEYYFQESGAVLPGWKVLHIPGLSFDGINSFSPVQMFRQTFGLGLAVEEYGARFFGQGTHVGGFFEHPARLSSEVHGRLKTELEQKYKGLQNAHGVIVLEEGMKYSALGMKMEDIQFIESRKFTATEMARIHGVPPHLIGDLEKATFSNIEEQGIEAVTYLFRSWAVRWEQALNIKLFTPQERERLYCKFELEGLLRGNTKARFQAYHIALQDGVYSINEVREMEDKNPIPDGDAHRVAMNTTEVGKEKEDDEDE